MPARHEVSFRSRDFNGDGRREQKRGRRQPVNDLTPPSPGEGQHPCPRGTRCSSSARDEDGAWHPLLINSVFCPADEAAVINTLPGLPESYARLSHQMTDPLRSKGPGPGSRQPPGSRVLIGAGDEALLREAAAVLNGWAARVRAVPGISLSPRRRLPYTQAGVEENCTVLARHAVQLLALPPGPTLRTWEYPPGRHAPAPALPPLHAMAAGARRTARTPFPAAVPCRRCGTFVTPSPSGKHWWPAVCTHAVTLPSAYAEDKDGNRYPVAWSCAECSTPFRGSPPAPRPACAHEPSAAAAPPRPAGRRQGQARTQAEVEAEIEGLEVVRAGDGWVTAITELSGADAGLDILDLSSRFKGRLQESDPPPEYLDGVPCHGCEAMSLVRAPLPAGPEREGEKPAFSVCTVPSCRHVMTRGEYDDWAKRYAIWAQGTEIACTRCDQKRCEECQWNGCACRARGHAAA